MKIKPCFILREVAGVHLLLSVGAHTDAPAAMKLNETGAALFRRLEIGATEDELCTFLLSEYDVEEGIARKDVLQFLDSLKKIDALEE